MKKKLFIVIATLCLFLVGCSNEFAKEEYNSAESIAKTGDRYAKKISVFNPIDGGYSLTVSEFDGRETLWSKNVKEEQNIEMEFSLTLSEGQAKVVIVNEEGNVTTLIECSPETVTDGLVSKTVELSKGENNIKIVGYDCKDLELKMLFVDTQGEF